jgi:hypothetical protein
VKQRRKPKTPKTPETPETPETVVKRRLDVDGTKKQPTVTGVYKILKHPKPVMRKSPETRWR